MAKHLLSRCIKEGHKGHVVRSTVDRHLQQAVNQTIDRNRRKLRANEIYNLAAIVVETGSGQTLSYVGNVNGAGNEDHGHDVDIIMARRSTGSILKPFLYAALLDEGFMLPATLIPDIPTIIDGFAPKNFTETYDGAIPANRALARSLNVPAVYMLRDYSYEKFHRKLGELGLTTIDQPPSHYGLSLILGGAEASLWELTGAYASMARTLNLYFRYPEPLRYNKNDFHPLVYVPDGGQVNHTGRSKSGIFNAGALWHTLNAMLDVNRPDEESSWRLFSSSRKIAWKTGTSYGFRDAWAIGVTPDYVVGVWVGNADGEGRPGLTGLEAAAPVLFDIFNLLPQGRSWFDAPFSDMKRQKVCRLSGFTASEICDETDSVWIPSKGAVTPVCPYHLLVHLDRNGMRVNGDCDRVSAMVHRSWFVLPPAMEWYYKSKNAGYKDLPPLRSDCHSGSGLASMQLIYPKTYSRIYVPRELDGVRGKTVFEVAHRSPSTRIFWHLDERFVGATTRIHQMALQPGEGAHMLTLVDENGETLKLAFEVVGE